MEDDKIIILMDHTIHHNEHHAEDFINLANDLEKAGETDASNLAKDAAKDVENAVEKLKEAREIYKKNKKLTS